MMKTKPLTSTTRSASSLRWPWKAQFLALVSAAAVLGDTVAVVHNEDATRARCSEASASFQGSLGLTHLFALDENTDLTTAGGAWELTDDDRLALSNLFLETYNNEQQGDGYCDPKYRRLSSVYISSATIGYPRYPKEELDVLLPSDSHRNASVVTAHIEYNLQGYCEGCHDQPFDTEALVFESVEPPRGLRQRQPLSTPGGAMTRSQRLRAEVDPSPSWSQDCQCRSSDAYQRAPQEEEFVQALNQVVSKQRQQRYTTVASRLIAIEAYKEEVKSLLPEPDRRRSLVELVGSRQQGLITVDEYACNAITRQFDATVFLRVPSASLVETGSMSALEESFRITYNNLTFTLCDRTHFRTITSVKAVVEGDAVDSVVTLDQVWMMDVDRSETLGEEETRVITLQISTDCKECNATTSLFHPTEETMSAPATGGVSLPFSVGGALANYASSSTRQGSSSCLCPANDTNVFRAPTVEEFRVEFNAQHSVPDVQDPLLLQVEEEQRFDCAAPQTTTQSFSAYGHVVLGVLLDRASPFVNATEKTLLEQAFYETYNQLSYLHCDEYHRTVVNVTFLFDQDQDIAAKGLEDASDVTVERPFVFLVEGQCYGCPEGEEIRLFDHAPVTERHLEGIRPRSNSRRLQLDGVCTCAPGVEPGAPPSEEDFLMAFNQTMQKLDLAGLKSAEDVMESAEVSCGDSGGAVVFTSSVLADVRADINNFTDADILLLEETFREVYNDLTFTNCDGHFRQILNITAFAQPAANANTFRDRGNRLQTEDGIRRLQSDNITVTLNATTTAVMFSVTGECRNCQRTSSSNFELFDDGFGSDTSTGDITRKLRAASTGLSVAGRNLQEDVCVCPVDTEPGDNQGPTAEEFQAAFSQRLSELQAKGDFPPPPTSEDGDTVINVIETFPVVCGTNITEFNSYVYTGLQVDVKQFDEVERLKIEQGFKTLYNDLSFTGCDGFFRTIKNVEMIFGQIVDGGDLGAPLNRQLQGVGNVTSGNATNVTRLDPTMFSVTGECRNCRVSDSNSFRIFDEAFRRVLADAVEFGATGMVSRNLNAFSLPEDTCLCPTGTAPGAGPASIQFKPDFNDFVMTTTNGTGVAVNDRSIVEVDIACGFDTLEVVDTQYRVTIPTDVLELPDSELQSFMSQAYPTAYNDVRSGECSPVVLETEIMPEIERRRLQVPVRRRLQAGYVRRTVRLVTIRPKNETALFSDEEHEIRVAQRVYELFLESRFSRSITLDVSSPPSAAPTAAPTPEPTLPPTREPTDEPTPAPTSAPAPAPTSAPTPAPTSAPTRPPTASPTTAPTTVSPTTAPTRPPSGTPTPIPTLDPTAGPTSPPSKSPTVRPTTAPTRPPSASPTPVPTLDPTAGPTTPNPTWERASVVRFVLIDCSTGSAVPGYDSLSDGVELDRAVLPERLTIEAITDPPEIGEVQFFLDGDLIITETKWPYSMSSNTGSGGFRPSTHLEPSSGTRTLEAVPIWWWGFEGETLEISFTVIRSTETEG